MLPSGAIARNVAETQETHNGFYRLSHRGLLLARHRFIAGYTTYLCSARQLGSVVAALFREFDALPVGSREGLRERNVVRVQRKGACTFSFIQRLQ